MQVNSVTRTIYNVLLRRILVKGTCKSCRLFATPMSPDADIFSTPPTSPFDSIRPSLSRKSSRPSSLRLDSTRTEWPNNIVLETSGAAILTGNETMTPTSATAPHSRMESQPIPGSNGIFRQPLQSPCFVHSHLDKGASLTEWLRNKQTALIPEVGVAQSLQRNGINGSDHQISPPSSASSSVISSSNDEDDYGASLTKQLAETAVGVREMSKQLGTSYYRHFCWPLVLHPFLRPCSC